MSTTPATSFRSWASYFGDLAETVDAGVSPGTELRTVIAGFETGDHEQSRPIPLPQSGTAFGFVARGSVRVTDSLIPDFPTTVGRECHFAIPGALTLDLNPGSRLLLVQLDEFRALRSFGGPLERAGRLRYIDGCSDSILAPPARLGDPCLNHLHFPEGIEQTAHTHPSVRAGIVVRGLGWCETQEGLTPLEPGLIFCIPRDTEHRFLTTDSSMDVVAYHPDSDAGPTDEDHPMLNRTLVGGQKLDNTQGRHANADLVLGSVQE